MAVVNRLLSSVKSGLVVGGIIKSGRENEKGSLKRGKPDAGVKQ